MKVVQAPRSQKHNLTDWDSSGETWVEIKETRVAEATVRDQELAKVVVEHGRDTSREIYDLSNAARLTAECWLSFVDSNLQLETRDPAGNVLQVTPLFWAGMTERDFRRNFGVLPVDLALEWHEAVLSVNPQWRIRLE